MSGICGIFRQDSRPVRDYDIGAMVKKLERRGPEGSSQRQKDHVGLGYTLLATTPEMAWEIQPFHHAPSDCTITADARLDNREELLTALDLNRPGNEIGDAEIILHSYLAWGEACPERLLGDFAFAVYDGNKGRLFCARDHFGIRPFYYHHSEHRLFAFASEPEALLKLDDVPYSLNEARIADFLVEELEGLDLVSTFYNGVLRLPPAHSISVTTSGLRLWRYWMLEAGPELRLGSDEDYAEAFLDVYTEAVRCRLRSHGRVGSMLSGGMDSGSVVAVASELLEKEGRGPLPTFSAISSQPENCIESRTLQLSQSLAGLEPYDTNPEQLRNSWSSILSAVSHAGEPFEMDEILVHCVYQQAKTQGVNVLLDGVPGDNVLSETGYIPRLVRNGHWLTAYREMRLRNRFFEGGATPVLQLLRAAGSAFAPEVLKDVYSHHINGNMHPGRISDRIRYSGIRADFARRIDLEGRFRTIYDIPGTAILSPLGEVTAIGMRQPYITAGIERYGRIASSLGIESRHPWMDRRLVELCISLPGHQRLAKGWPKAILRKAMKGHLPYRVRYRRGKEHLGPNFSSRFLSMACLSLQQAVLGQRFILERYINEDTIESVLKLSCKMSDIKELQNFSNLVFLALWLKSRKQISWPNYPEK